MSGEITQGFSQFLYTYGPGAMLDLPNLPVIVAGLQDWRLGPDGTSHVIEEPRLSSLLARLDEARRPKGVVALRTPPLHDPDARGLSQPGVPVRIFPEWFVCDLPKGSPPPAPGGETRRRMAEFRHIKINSKEELSCDLDGATVRVSPVRFVAACAKGHLEDIDWRGVVHGAGQTCLRALHWVERGVSSDPTDVTVRCDCGKSVSLATLHIPELLGDCRASSPWLHPRREQGEVCDQKLRLLARSATNAYFPQTVSVISLPVESSLAAAAIQDHWSTIESVRELPNFLQILRQLPTTGPALKRFGDAEILTAIESMHGDAAAPDPDPRIEEFDRLTADVDLVGRERADSRLLARRLDLASIEMPDRIRRLVAGLVRVDRLREVACIYGFTRLEAAPSATENELNDISLATSGAPLDRATTWFPAVEQHGEGIFLRLRSDAILAWTGADGVKARGEELKRGEEMEAAMRDRPPEHLGVAYWALHGLSHALMIELSIECGYPLSSLKERIYASKPGGLPRHGLLIYTATTGGQGTLGGLSGMATQVPRLLDQAMKRLATCSNDPVCGEHRADDRHDGRHLHGAACHGCLLIPETSCEARNGRLDRLLIVGRGEGMPPLLGITD